jgi:hypothetical protein
MKTKAMQGLVKSVVRLFGLRGRWKWACRQMMAGHVVRRSSVLGAVRYRLDTEGQRRLEWSFHRLADETCWENAYFFLYDQEATDYEIVPPNV